jgi:translation initiation factor IF-3
MQHPELGRRILDRVAEEVAEFGKVEVMPKQDGRNMTMVLGPDKKAQANAQARRNEEAARDAEAQQQEASEGSTPEAAAPADARTD